MLLLLSHSVISNPFAISQTVAHQAPLSMEISTQEYWSGLPFHSPGDLPGPETELTSSALQVDFSDFNYRVKIPKKKRFCCVV